MNNYSPNMLKTFDECQQKFFFKYIEKLSVPQRFAIFEKGKKIHALANYYLRGENVEKMEKVLTADEKNAWDNLKSNKYFKLNVVNTEYNLSCRVGQYWVGGRLDALMREGERENGKRGKEIGNCELGIEPFDRSTLRPFDPSPLHPFTLSANFVILDYKTGNIPKDAEKEFQTIVYLLCADKFLQQKGGYGSLKFVYIGLKPLTPNSSSARGEGSSQHTEKEILFNEDLKKQYEEKILSTCGKIDFAVNSNVFSKNIERCKTCEYCKLCK
ncbi:MAG: PD-(D/E)XK nuclease family protein [Candidatus Gastranaerophilaceae bacterium]